MLLSSVASADDKDEAQKHFQHAKELYQQGNYREARKELEEAHDLDPSAKDLVFNLGIVCEKLDRIDDALRYFHQYLDMDLDPTERQRAETTIKRLEGAKRSRPKEHAAPPPAPIVVTQTAPIGRVDGFTVTSAVLALSGLAVGSIFGIMALTSRPASGFVTGRDGTYQDLKDKADQAHTLAIVSDVAFIAGAVFTGLTAYLFFGRRQNVQRGQNTTNVTAAILPNGAAIGLGGSF